MDKKTIIKEMAANISQRVNDYGHTNQLFGSWNSDFSEEDRKALNAFLESEYHIDTIRISDYDDLYLSEDICPRNALSIIKLSQKSAPIAFEERAAREAINRRIHSIAEGIDSFIESIIFGDGPTGNKKESADKNLDSSVSLLFGTDKANKKNYSTYKNSSAKGNDSTDKNSNAEEDAIDELKLLILLLFGYNASDDESD